MTTRNLLRLAMENPEGLVVQLDYVDTKGKTTSRVISPIRILATNRLLALCLCREEPRQFHLDRCSNMRLRRAADYVMPVVMT